MGINVAIAVCSEGDFPSEHICQLKNVRED